MQIQTLLQNKERLEPFSNDLHSKLSTFIASLPAKTRQSFQISFWPRFHEFRLKEAVPIWEHHLKTIVSDLDHILIQKATLEYALVLLKDEIMIRTQETSTGSATEASKDVRRHNLTLEEENAIRYASGYVMMKRFDSKGMMDISECLTL
jgi:hypothetical protein